MAIAAVDEVNVLPVVAVKIRHTYARAELFKIDGDALVAFEVGETDSGFFGDIGEVDGVGMRSLSRRYQHDQDGEKRKSKKQDTESSRGAVGRA
jgi:hypothetical protein